MLEFALKHPGPSAIRYPRGRVPEGCEYRTEIELGSGEILKEGTDIALVATGSCVIPALKASERLEKVGINALVINARFIKPLDKELLMAVSGRISKIITIEENVLQGGFGSAVMECLHEVEMNHVRIKRLGIPDRFIEQGGPDRLRAKYGINEEAILHAALSFMREPTFSN